MYKPEKPHPPVLQTPKWGRHSQNIKTLSKRTTPKLNTPTRLAEVSVASALVVGGLGTMRYLWKKWMNRNVDVNLKHKPKSDIVHESSSTALYGNKAKENVWDRTAARKESREDMKGLFAEWKQIIEKEKDMFLEIHPKHIIDLTVDDVHDVAVNSAPAVSTEVMRVIDAVIAGADRMIQFEEDPLIQQVGFFYKNWSREKIVTRLLRSRVTTFNRNLRWYDNRLGLDLGWGDRAYVKRIKNDLESFLLPQEAYLASLLGMRFSTRVKNDGSELNMGKPGLDQKYERRATVYGLGADCMREEPTNSPINVIVDTYLQTLAKRLKLQNTNNNYNLCLARSYLIHTNLFQDLMGAHFANKRITLRLRHNIHTFGDSPHNMAYVRGIALAMRDYVKPNGPIKFVEIFLNLPDEDSEKIAVDAAAKAGVTLSFSYGEIFESLKEDRRDTVLVASFPWNGYSAPFNNFWYGVTADKESAIGNATVLPYTAMGFIMPGIYLPEVEYDANS
jgi:hypothetical protein